MSDRRKLYAKSIDGQLPTPEQMRQLGQMAGNAFLEIRARTRDPDLVFALSDAFHCLPVVMHESSFSWSWFLIFLEELERQYPEVGGRYLSTFDEIVGFRASSSDF